MFALLDNVGGIIYRMGTYPMQPTPVADIIQKHLKLPVAIDNYANVMARAEHWFRNDMHLDDFTLISLDLGMGSARYVGGALSGGANGFSSEMGHVKITWKPGRQCYCGANGCIAAYSSIWGIVIQICKHRGREQPAFGEPLKVFREFVGDARNGDDYVQKIFAQAGKILGTAIANHINSHDPGRVIILVQDPLLSAVLSTSLYAAVEKNTMLPIYERTSIKIKTAADDHVWKGSAALVLEQIYRLLRLPTLPVVDGHML